MNIVVEGIDNSGKSTLAKYIATHLGWTYQHSGGPPKYEDEINIRIDNFNKLSGRVFDRHAAISQPIYRTCRGDTADGTRVRQAMIFEFYKTRPLLIYCDPLQRRLKGQGHNPDVDTPQRQDQVAEFYDQMLKMYRSWAIEHAHIMYRIGDDVQRIVHWAAQYSQDNNYGLR